MQDNRLTTSWQLPVLAFSGILALVGGAVFVAVGLTEQRELTSSPPGPAASAG